MLILHVFFFLDHPYFVGVQYHPEFLSRPLKPSPPFLGLLLAACGKLQSYIERGGKLSPASSFDESEYPGNWSNLKKPFSFKWIDCRIFSNFAIF